MLFCYVVFDTFDVFDTKNNFFELLPDDSCMLLRIIEVFYVLYFYLVVYLHLISIIFFFISLLYSSDYWTISFYLDSFLSLSGSHITHIAAGSQHILALSHTHELHTWGSGKHGQLGIVERVFREEDCHIQTPTRAQVMCSCEYDIILKTMLNPLTLLLK